MKLNEVLSSQDKTRQSRIILGKCGQRKGQYIGCRCFSYKTSFGPNSAGCKEYYPTFQLAVNGESQWLKEA